MLTGIYAADADQLSMAAVFPRMIQMESEHGSLTRAFLRSFTGRSSPVQPQAEYTQTPPSAPKRKPRGTVFTFLTGMQALPNRLAENVRIRYNVSDPRIGDARATVIATPAYSAARIVELRNPSLAALLEKIRYAPMVIAATSVPEDSFRQPLRGFGFLVPRHQQMHLLGTLFSSALFTGRAPSGRVLLTSFIGGAFEPEAVDWPGDRVYEIVCSEVQHALKTAALPEPVALFRHRFAIPQYNIGHEDWAESVRAELKQSPGLFLAGNYIEGVSVSACMEQGERTAHAVAEYLRRST
jgi:oxygen-dependent protoporphyrinogen oxidase